MDFRIFKEKYQKVEPKELANNTSSKPLVSVCVQTYQHKDFIRDCLEGILMQKTDFPFEILLGEDHSTDGTRDICIEYAEKYLDQIRLVLHHRENNIKINGCSTGRFNFLFNLAAANGKYISICEGDDYWTDPLKLQKQVDFLENNPEYSYCAHNSKRLKGGELISNAMEPHEITFDKHIFSNYINTCTLMFRKVYVQDMPKKLLKVNALDWGMQLWALKRATGYFFEDDMGVYRIHEKGMWNQLSAKEMCMRGVKILKQFKKIFKDKADKKNIDLAIAKRRKDFGF